MTAEIAILNRGAVALAADSATTVTYWEGGERKKRFFKDANKIFHISNHAPVGLMIYSNSELQGMPWEVIAKAYRDARGTRMHSSLDEYVADFFDFIKTDRNMFPVEYQKHSLASAIVKAAGVLTFVANPKPDIVAASGKTFEQLGQEKLADRKRAIEGATFLGGVDQAFIDNEVKGLSALCIKGNADFPSIEDDVDFKAIAGHITAEEIFELAALAVFKERFSPFQQTGLAFAGYGETEYFPALRHYNCHALVLGRLICDQVDKGVTIDLQNSSEIRPLATTDTINTFIRGASNMALWEMDTLLTQALDGIEADLVASGRLQQLGEIDAEKRAAKSKITDGLSAHLWLNHTAPLRRVVGMLSVADLGQLAETLVSIESLKERVTQNTESVSGPIDVAVITKSDGFIWLKRKHYFDAALNPRFFIRKGLN